MILAEHSCSIINNSKKSPIKEKSSLPFVPSFRYWSILKKIQVFKSRTSHTLAYKDTRDFFIYLKALGETHNV